MVWTTFNPVEAIPWAAGTIVVHGISYPVDDDYPVDNMSYPVDTLYLLHPVDVYRGHMKISRGFHIPWTHTVENMSHPVDTLSLFYPVGVSRGLTSCEYMVWRT